MKHRTETETSIGRLLAVMAALRTPQTGCAWDLEQDFASIAPYTLEEAYEVVDAIERGDMADLQDELGDLLLQVVFHGQMASEAGLFTFDDIAQAVADKMIRRHPHVFGDSNVSQGAQTPAAVRQNWEAIKAAEKANKDKDKANDTTSLVDNVPLALPGLTRAVKLQKRAARVGFDWTQAAPILAKIKEEIAELEEVLNGNDTNNNDNQPQTARLEEEYGDILFALANLARHLRFDPETALRNANQKFINRFKWMENKAKQEGKDLASMPLEDMELLWQQAKAEV